MERVLFIGLLILGLATFKVTAQAVRIGSFVEVQHFTRGVVYAVDEVTLRIDDFNYDGAGPRVFLYYYKKNDSPGSAFNAAPGGIVIRASTSNGVNSEGRLTRAFNKEQVFFTMPPGSTVHDIGHLTVWCAFVNQFFVEPLAFPDNIALNGGSTPAPQEPQNCAVLNSQLQLSWKLNTTAPNPLATFTLCGCLRTDQYMAFGLSGSADSINMVGGDVTVAWVDSEPHAEDYFLERREQCRNGTGVCSDKTSRAGATCKEDNFDISGSVRDGVTCVTYSRPLNTGDINCDTPFDVSRPVYTIWALGPLGASAFQHFERSGFSTQPINLTREPVNECTSPPTCTNCEPFTNSSIAAPEGRTFTAEIGASGGAQGYVAITGQAGWGIAWYIDGVLIPELILMRGECYTFRVFGGDNVNDRSNYHPFYITDSISGGRLLNTPTERESERVFAGFANNNQPIGVGTLCNLREGSGSEAIRQQCGTRQQYTDSLQRTCASATPTPGVVVFTPDESTPDVVYYQCATHRNLGWRIRIMSSSGPVFNQSLFTVLTLAFAVISIFSLF